MLKIYPERDERNHDITIIYDQKTFVCLVEINVNCFEEKLK